MQRNEQEEFDRFVRFQVFVAASMKVTFFWDIAPCSLVEVDRRFRGAYCLHKQREKRLLIRVPPDCFPSMTSLLHESGCNENPVFILLVTVFAMGSIKNSVFV
jgi:hypothetical protein